MLSPHTSGKYEFDEDLDPETLELIEQQQAQFLTGELRNVRSNLDLLLRENDMLKQQLIQQEITLNGREKAMRQEMLSRVRELESNLAFKEQEIRTLEIRGGVGGSNLTLTTIPSIPTIPTLTQSTLSTDSTRDKCVDTAELLLDSTIPCSTASHVPVDCLTSLFC
jgi:hypothetical protein